MRVVDTQEVSQRTVYNSKHKNQQPSAQHAFKKSNFWQLSFFRMKEEPFKTQNTKWRFDHRSLDAIKTM